MNLTLFQALRLINEGCSVGIISEGEYIINPTSMYRIPLAKVADYLSFRVTEITVNANGALLVYVEQPGYGVRV